MYKPFVPLNDWIVIRVVEDQVDESGVIVPKKYRQQSNCGIVVSVSTNIKELKSGDKVLFGQYNSEKFNKDGEELELVRIQDIRGVERETI